MLRQSGQAHSPHNSVGTLHRLASIAVGPPLLIHEFHLVSVFTRSSAPLLRLEVSETIAPRSRLSSGRFTRLNLHLLLAMAIIHSAHSAEREDTSSSPAHSTTIRRYKAGGTSSELTTAVNAAWGLIMRMSASPRMLARNVEIEDTTHHCMNAMLLLQLTRILILDVHSQRSAPDSAHLTNSSIFRRTPRMGIPGHTTITPIIRARLVGLG